MVVITAQDLFFLFTGLVLGAIAYAGYKDWKKHPEPLFETDENIIKDAEKRGEM